MGCAAASAGRVAANRIIRAVIRAIRIVAGRGVVSSSGIRVVHRVVVARHLACGKRVCRLSAGRTGFIGRASSEKKSVLDLYPRTAEQRFWICAVYAHVDGADRIHLVEHRTDIDSAALWAFWHVCRVEDFLCAYKL